MKFGTSVPFVFPTFPATRERFRGLLASMRKGAFIERSMGAYSPDEPAAQPDGGGDRRPGSATRS
jgi:hypothetical protein